ncbi:MAG: SAM-dependent chlorinase/fluorinase [Deltaproteobacteria bacterium]|nr:SAM-dependent chlorinase/fluorinase [Deltaproteobacteria bacterium]
MRHRRVVETESYISVGQNKPLAIIGSRDYLELAVCCGHAGRFFRAKKGDTVMLFAKTA